MRDGPQRYMFCNYGAAGNHFSAIQGSAAEGVAVNGGGDRQGPIEKDRWYDISLVLTNNSAEMLLDGKRVGKIDALPLPEFFATAGYDRKSRSVVLRATNYQAMPVRAEIELVGADAIGSSGEQIVIRANRLDAENSLDTPLRIRAQIASPSRLRLQVHCRFAGVFGECVQSADPPLAFEEFIHE